MTNITTADLTGERSGGGGFGACRPLLLNNDDYPVTYKPITMLAWVLNSLLAVLYARFEGRGD